MTGILMGAETQNSHEKPMSSCFRMARKWTAQATSVTPLYSFAFPSLLIVRPSNTSIITAVVNIEQQVFEENIFADPLRTPVVQNRQQTGLGGNFWLVTMEMDIVGVYAHFAEKLASRQDQLVVALLSIDQSTGAAFSTLIPLLWACAVKNRTLPEQAEPVFIIPGVVQSVVTQNITVRAITEIMRILEIAGPAPTHVFQLASRQVLNTVSLLHASKMPLLFVHNDLCDSFFNPGQSYENCPTRFAETLLSSYSTQHGAETQLTQREILVLAASTDLQYNLGIDSTLLSQSPDTLCPFNTFVPHTAVKQANGLTLTSDCAVCADAQFWDQNTCQDCESAVDACENYSPRTRSKPCSWTHDLLCGPR
jgi:hypothetical protein